jgi:hypothetical protein
MNAPPPSELWPSGHLDAVIINTDPNQTWPQSGLEGKRTAPTSYNACLS